MRKIILLIVFAMISVIFAGAAIAQTMPGSNQQPRPSFNSAPPSSTLQRPGPNATTQGLQEKPGTNPSMMPERPLGNNKAGSPSGDMQQKCQTVEKVITDQAQKGTEMLVKMYQQLTSIFTGVQNYYTQKLVPNGVSLQNYSELAANIQASQSAVLTDMQAAQNDAKNFSCQGNKPGQQVAQFRTDMQTTIKAMIAYRDAIKNFVQEVVKAAQNVTETANTTATNSAQ